MPTISGGTDLPAVASTIWKVAMAKRQKKWPTKADIDALDAQQKELEAKKKQLRTLMSERFAVLAERAGLMELEIPDATLEQEFRALAARFRGGLPVQSVGADGPKAGEPGSTEAAHGARPTQG